MKNLRNSILDNTLGPWDFENWRDYIQPVVYHSKNTDAPYDLIVVIGEGSAGESEMPVPGMADRTDLAGKIYADQGSENNAFPAVVFTSGLTPGEDGFTPHSQAPINYNNEQKLVPSEDVHQILFSSDTLGELFAVMQSCMHPQNKKFSLPGEHQQLDQLPHKGEFAKEKLREIRENDAARILIIVPDYHGPRVQAMAEKIFNLQQGTADKTAIAFQVDALPIENPYLPEAARQAIVEAEPPKIKRDQEALKDITTVSGFSKWLTEKHGLYNGSAFDNRRESILQGGGRNLPAFSDPANTVPAIQKFTLPRLEPG